MLFFDIVDFSGLKGSKAAACSALFNSVCKVESVETLLVLIFNAFPV